MAGGGRIKTRCSRFCFDASEHSPGTRGERTGPLSKPKEQDEEWLLHVRHVFLQHPPAGQPLHPRSGIPRTPHIHRTRATQLGRSLRPRQKGSSGRGGGWRVEREG